MKSCIVAVAKNEEKYLKDWIEYHLNLGFDRILIADNNPEGNQGQLVIMNQYSQVIPIDVLGDKLKNIGYQVNLYKNLHDFIKQNYPEIEWIAYIDIDEYLDLDGMKVNDFLSQDKFKDADLIHVNWKCYGDNDLVYYEPRPVIERFTRPAPIDLVYSDTQFCGDRFYMNNHVKSILKVTDKEFTFTSPHSVVFKDDSKCVDVAGNLQNGDIPFQPICYDGGHLKHFITKSTEEFIERKLKNNTRADFGNSKYLEEFTNYFNINTKTFTKLKLIKERCTDDFNRSITKM